MSDCLKFLCCRYRLLLFSGWCFTHQYKNTAQFCFYSVSTVTQNTNTQKIVSHGYNQSAYVHLIANIGDRKSIELRPDERCECAWLIAEIYPRFDCAPHLFVATRDGGSTAIYGDAPTITKYPAGGEYVEGYVRVTFPGKWYHAIIIGSQLSKVTTVN